MINRIAVITLGCSKNVVDSEFLIAQLEANNFTVTHDSLSSEPQIVIINTCGFIEDAKQESINTILEYVQGKEQGYVTQLYVMGCLSERYKEALQQEIPEVDGFYGVLGKQNGTELLKSLDATYKETEQFKRTTTTPDHYAYLKIAEGCNHTCAFCAIPLIKGTYKSRPHEELIAESKLLAAKGVKELILIAQDTSFYGRELYKSFKLSELIKEISDIEGIEWIRLQYMYPNYLPIDVLEEMRDNEKVCNYVDLPFQHISDRMLKIMKRNISKDQVIQTIKQCRDIVPEIVLRTTLLVGHPGETESDFETLYSFVEEMQFDRLGVFSYSHEDNTYAFNNYEDDVPEEVKQQRTHEIMELQQQISYELNSQKINNVYPVIIDRKEGSSYIGRTQYDAPEVDGEVIIPNDSNSRLIKPGGIYSVKITDYTEYDLYGKLV